jgi:tRNA(Ile)-lysidine synthetase-like protein
MFETIYDIWFENPKNWLPITPKEKERVDSYFYTTCYKKEWVDVKHIHIQQNVTKKEKLGCMIYYDQLIRHFERKDPTITVDVEMYRKQLEPYVYDWIEEWFHEFQETELLFCLMVLKHLKQYENVLEIIHLWLQSKEMVIKDCIYLSKFYYDTYKKLYTQSYIASHIQKSTWKKGDSFSFDPMTVCDHYNEKGVCIDTFDTKDQLLELPKKEQVIVSLSGGVDSMTTLYLLNQMKTPSIELCACHILYGNRKESMEEYHILEEYCNQLGIDLYMYQINYLRRNEVDRAFYEKMTRDIRFFVYKSLIHKENYGVYMGHINEDVIENIWSNFSRGQHLFDLKKMSVEVEQEDVILVRPFLYTSKENIYEIAHRYQIPYLKNTTPTWSNRGKFRMDFYEATHRQYGKQVDEKIMEVADRFHYVGLVLNRMIYEPIDKSYDDIHKTIDVSRAMEAMLDELGWLEVFTKLCHTRLKISKPTIRSVRQFKQRVEKYKDGVLKFQMKKDLQCLFYKEGETYKIKIL